MDALSVFLKQGKRMLCRWVFVHEKSEGVEEATYVGSSLARLIEPAAMREVRASRNLEASVQLQSRSLNRATRNQDLNQNTRVSSKHQSNK